MYPDFQSSSLNHVRILEQLHDGSQNEAGGGDHTETLVRICAWFPEIKSGCTSGLACRIRIGYLDEHTDRPYDQKCIGGLPRSPLSHSQTTIRR